MALPEGSPAPAPKEEIPFLVMEAAKRIRVSEYLQLRFQRGWDIGSGEYGQIFAVADAVIGYQTAKGKEPYYLTDELELSADPRVIGARLILTNVPLPKYLTARQVALQGQLAWNFEKIKAFGGKELIEKGKKMMEDLLLTQAVSEAIKNA